MKKNIKAYHKSGFFEQNINDSRSKVARIKAVLAELKDP
jgi:hypothetical protein